MWSQSVLSQTTILKESIVFNCFEPALQDNAQLIAQIILTVSLTDH